jgi:hypothetical protein
MTGPVNASNFGYRKLAFAMNTYSFLFLDADIVTLSVKSFAIF